MTCNNGLSMAPQYYNNPHGYGCVYSRLNIVISFDKMYVNFKRNSCRYCLIIFKNNIRRLITNI